MTFPGILRQLLKEKKTSCFLTTCVKLFVCAVTRAVMLYVTAPLLVTGLTWDRSWLVIPVHLLPSGRKEGKGWWVQQLMQWWLELSDADSQTETGLPSNQLFWSILPRSPTSSLGYQGSHKQINRFGFVKNLSMGTLKLIFFPSGRFVLMLQDDTV